MDLSDLVVTLSTRVSRDSAGSHQINRPIGSERAILGMALLPHKFSILRPCKRSSPSVRHKCSNARRGIEISRSVSPVGERSFGEHGARGEEPRSRPAFLRFEHDMPMHELRPQELCNRIDQQVEPGPRMR